MVGVAVGRIVAEDQRSLIVSVAARPSKSPTYASMKAVYLAFRSFLRSLQDILTLHLTPLSFYTQHYCDSVSIALANHNKKLSRSRTHKETNHTQPHRHSIPTTLPHLLQTEAWEGRRKIGAKHCSMVLTHTRTAAPRDPNKFPTTQLFLLGML